MPKLFSKRTTKLFAVISIVAGFLITQNIAISATTGEVYPSLGTSVSESPWSVNGWNTPTNIYSDNGATANVTAASYDTGDQTFVLKATGFDFSGIPDGSTINGATARINTFYRSGQGSGSVDLCQLLNISRAKVGTNKCSAPIPLTTNTGTILTIGGGSDVWGNALTTSWIKDPDFGIAIGILATENNADVDVDYVTLEISYTPPPSGSVSAAPNTCTISSGANTCTVPFTWNITNATSPNLYNATTANTYSTSASGTGVSYPITNGSNTVQVRDSSTVLNSTTATGSCITGTTWNGSSCAVDNTTPTLSISQPDGVSDTVTAGSSYNITYSLADAEQIVTAAFYYDTDATGLNGTAITGACASAGEGANATCSWNTTGMTPGNYYVYGLTSDGIAPQVNAYSSGVITINAVPVVPTVTSPTATGITTTGATLGANVTSLGIPASISARGTCWGTSASPTTNCAAEGGTTTGVFSHARTGMSPNTFYYYRGYATNSTGTGYSADGTFTTSLTTGTISAAPNTCTISSGASTCTVPFTWNITNATSPNLFNSTTVNTYSTSASGTGVSYLITNGANTVQVRDSSTVLNSTTATGSCVSGTTWNGSSCEAVVTYYTIYASSGANGNVTPGATTTIASGGSQAYAITPSSGYEVATLLIDSAPITATTTYTFTNIQANHTISATFSLLPVTHTITSSAGSNGTINPLGATVVADGANQTFNIIPDSGFNIATLVVDGGGVSTSTSYTFTNVTANHTISATFALIPPPPGSFTIIANQNPNGTVSPSGSTVVTEGSSQAYTITPNSGYDVGSIIIDSSTLSSTSTTYTFTNVTANHTIEATFIALPSTEPVVSGARRLASIIFSGKAFPQGIISIIRREPGNEIVSSQKGTTDGNGFFDIRFTDIPTGTHSFGLLIKDPDGRTSQTKFFLVDATRGDEIYKNIITPPTIDILNGQVSRGGNVKIFGYASPGHTIRVYINDILSKEALAGRGGVYSFDIPTGALDFGQHKVRAKQINLDGGIASDFSTERTFIVSKLTVVKADFSGDGKIDIKDWSIFLARWGGKSSIGRSGIDLNSDGKVDIADFSIFIKTIRKK